MIGLKIADIKILIFMILLAGGVVFLSACEEEASAPPPQGGGASAQKPVAAKKIEVAADEVKKEIKYLYDPSGKRDPFHPTIEDVAPSQAQVITDTGTPGEPAPPPTEPEMYELTQFKLVAIMKLGKKSVAMIQDPEGKGHTLYMGTLVGRNRGKVVGIEEGRVLVEEKYRAVSGEIKPVIQEIVMQTGEAKK